MNKTFLSFLVFLLLSVCHDQVSAQAIDLVSLGVRANPDGAGLSAKLFLNPHFALEGEINGAGRINHIYLNGDRMESGPSFTIVALAEYNIIFPDPSWRIFLGPGLHIGSWDRYDHRRVNELAPAAQGIFGIDGILGLEYLFKTMPLGLSIDVKPGWNIADEQTYFPNNVFGFSARYYFGHKVRLANVEPVSEAY
jgi:hypothetical protein